MTIEAGHSLLHYRLIEKIGEGGMGVVWKAFDTTLERNVAIKVLPDTLTTDPERLARFEREARLLASLNHPNIAGVYGLHATSQPSALSFIAMELVSGDDLSQRLRHGALEVEEALSVARQIAEALETAHENGVIHRDLKPANVKLDLEGRVRVLDFGLAKAFDPAGGPKTADPMTSSTVTSYTVAGMILGTAAYMSPEQARGQIVDRRADIWAFGCLLYELIAGNRPFDGETVSDTLAAVLAREPDWTRLPVATPARVRELLRRCLIKNPKMRLRDIGDARIELDLAATESADDEAQADDTPRVPAARSLRLAIVALVLGLVLGGSASYVAFRGSAEPTAAKTTGPVSSHIVLPDELPLATGSDMPNSVEKRALALSHDGSRLVYVAGGDDSRRLVQRRIGSFDAEPIPGTEDAYSPAFSPDGRWVAFVTHSELKKVSFDGGDPVVLCEAHVAWSVSWSDDGHIYFTHHEFVLARVDEDGGKVESIGNDHFLSLHALPGSRGLLANLRSDWSVSMDTAEIVHIDETGQRTSILHGGYAPLYLPAGHLVFVRGGGLYVAPFDLDALRTTGPPVRVLDGVAVDSLWSGAQYDVSRNGTLVYLPGGDWSRTRPTWIDRDGNLEPLELPEQAYNNVRLAHDDSKLALQIVGAQDQIHVYDFRRETLVRLTLDGGNRFPVWTKDDKRILFRSYRDDRSSIYSQPLDGSANAERVMTDAQSGLAGPPRHDPQDVTADGRLLVFGANPGKVTGFDLWTFPLNGDEDPRPLLNGPSGEGLASISPEGRWLLYMSDKTGRWEAYVRPFPDVDRREWRVSSGGGDDPIWSPRPGELFYRDGPRLYSVRYASDPDFDPGPPELILETDFHNSLGLSFDVSADGRRFLVNRPVVAGQPNAALRLIQNWIDELR